MADDIPEVAPTLGLVTDAEIRRQAVEQLRAQVEDLQREVRDTAAMRTSQPAPAKKVFNPEISVGNLLTIGTLVGGAFLAYGQFTAATERAAATDERLSNAIAAVDRKAGDRSDNIVADITARRSFVNAKLEETERRVADIPLLRDAIKRLEGVSDAQQQRFEISRGERITDGKEMQAAINKLSTEVALLRQSVEARNRTTPPFLENPTWRGPIPPSLKARLFAEIANGRVR